MKGLLAVLVAVSIVCSSCNSDSDNLRDYKADMRDFVIGISEFAKTEQEGFIIIPQNGIELVTTTGDEDAALATDYLNAIDGHGQEDLFYGYDLDNVATPSSDREYLQVFLDKSRDNGNQILVTDYCSSPTNMTNSYSVNEADGYVSFAANERELNNIPTFPSTIHNENANEVLSLNEVQNFLYLINPENFADKASFISAVTATNYDLIIMDLFFRDGTEFTSSETTQLRQKANGGSRLVVSYMSIGEAEDYRFYWQSSWSSNSPAWLKAQNPDWPGNYKVEYWDSDWQQVIYGNNSSYLQKVLNAGFDGVYLDIIDAYEYFEGE